VRGQPGEGALHGPPARDHREALLACGLAHDVNGGAQDLGGPVEQSPCEPAVGEHEPHRRAQVGVEQHRLGAVTVVHGGGQYDEDQQQPEGVGDDEPLAAVDLLPRVVAAGLPPDGVGTLDALGVDQSGAGQRVAAFLHAQLGAHDGQDVLGHASLFPLVEVPIHGLPWREIRR